MTSARQRGRELCREASLAARWHLPALPVEREFARGLPRSASAFRACRGPFHEYGVSDRGRRRRSLDRTDAAKPRPLDTHRSQPGDRSLPQTHGIRASQPAASSFATCLRYHTRIGSSATSTAGSDMLPSRPMNRATLSVPGPGTMPSVITDLPTEVAIVRCPCVPRPHPDRHSAQVIRGVGRRVSWRATQRSRSRRRWSARTHPGARGTGDARRRTR